ncbi:MAG: hypothetical protein KDK51_05155 [Deltaproteobacteria bacterium]|nr:hypothetical protein [Deltaproteobacteria bacterium]
MENKQIDSHPFLPRLLFLLCFIVLAFTSVQLFVHFWVLAIFALYEKYILPMNAFRKPYWHGLLRYFPFFCVLFVLYAGFLQVGQTPVFTISLRGYSWTVFQESLVFAVHYILLFVEIFWLSYLILHEKKIDQIQCFFHGSLFLLTLNWNGSIQQSKQLFAVKQNFDQAIHARGVQFSRTQTIITLFAYSMRHMLIKINRQIPVFRQMWKSKTFFSPKWPERWIWIVPIFFFTAAFLKGSFASELYLKVQLLIFVLGVSMFYFIAVYQYEKMSSPHTWTLLDMLLFCFFTAWICYRVFTVSSDFYMVTWFDFVFVPMWPVHMWGAWLLLSGSFFMLKRGQM